MHLCGCKGTGLAAQSIRRDAVTMGTCTGSLRLAPATGTFRSVSLSAVGQTACTSRRLNFVSQVQGFSAACSGNAVSQSLLDKKAGGRECQVPPRLCKCHEYSSNYSRAGWVHGPRVGARVPLGIRRESAVFPVCRQCPGTWTQRATVRAGIFSPSRHGSAHHARLLGRHIISLSPPPTPSAPCGKLP